MKKQVDKRCCGKEIKKGDFIADRNGCIMCESCNNKNPGFAYLIGNIKENGHWCGEWIFYYNNEY